MKRTFALLALLVSCTDDPAGVTIGPRLVLTKKQVDLGPVTCGESAFAEVRIDNTGDVDADLAISSDNPRIAVQPQLLIPAGEARILPLSSTLYTPADAGTITLDGGIQASATIAVAMHGIGIPVTFDPPAVDFGSLLPNATKDLPLRATLGEGATFAIELILGPASTARFEVLGASGVRLYADNRTASFTLRYHASADPFAHDGTVPITVNGAGTCTPPSVALSGVTVP
jgi:hypothetical protein